MTISKQDGPIIAPGFPYSLRIITEDAKFPTGAVFKAHVRADPDDPDPPLAILLSADGEITRVDDFTADIAIDNTDTANFPANSHVWLDIVRTDVEPDIHLGFWVKIPTLQPVTR